MLIVIGLVANIKEQNGASESHNKLVNLTPVGAGH